MLSEAEKFDRMAQEEIARTDAWLAKHRRQHRRDIKLVVFGLLAWALLLGLMLWKGWL